MPEADPRDAALRAFAAGWRARFPQWELAERFLTRDARAPALASCVLWQELADAAWAGEDPRPGLAKLAWWQQELAEWQHGHARHPLAPWLAAAALPWSALAASLDSWQLLRERPRDAAERDAALLPAARAFAAIEQIQSHAAGAPLFVDDAALTAGSRHALRRLQRLHVNARGSAAMPLAEGDAGHAGEVHAWRQVLATPDAAARAPTASAALQGVLLARHARPTARRDTLRWPFVCWRAARNGRD